MNQKLTPVANLMERPKIGRLLLEEGSRGSPSVNPSESARLSPLILNVNSPNVDTSSPRSNLEYESNLNTLALLSQRSPIYLIAPYFVAVTVLLS